MFTENLAETNRALGIVPPIVPTAPWRIKAAAITGRWTLHVVFNDDTEGDVDLEAFVNAPDAGVFEALRDPEVFNRAHLFLGALTWPGELDLAPDAMHDAIKATGIYAPEAEAVT